MVTVTVGDADTVAAALVTTDEAATLAGVSSRTIRRWVQRGFLPATETPNGYLLSPADLPAARRAAGHGRGHGQRPPGHDRGHGHADTATDADAATAVAVNPNARAQLEAIRDEWLAPLVERIGQLEREIGRLEGARDAQAAEVAAKDEMIAELRRRAELAEHALHLPQAEETSGASAASVEPPVASAPAPTLWRRLRRAFGGG